MLNAQAHHNAELTHVVIKFSFTQNHGRSNGLHNVYAIMLRGSRRPDPLENKKVFAGSDYLTASASRRYFNLGEILVQLKWTKLLKPRRIYHGNFFGIGSSYGRPIYIYIPCLTHSYTLQYLYINIKCFLTFDLVKVKVKRFYLA